MKKMIFTAVVLALIVVGCDNLGDNLGTGDNNYFSFEGEKSPVRNARSFRSGDNYTFQLYSNSNAATSDYFIEITFPDNLNDTLFTLPLSKGDWSVNGAADNIAYSGNRSGRNAFQSANVQIRVVDGAGTVDLKFSLALNDNRCVTGFYKGTIEGY